MEEELSWAAAGGQQGDRDVKQQKAQWFCKTAKSMKQQASGYVNNNQTRGRVGKL